MATLNDIHSKHHGGGIHSQLPEYPTYPTNSLDFLQHLRTHQNGVVKRSTINLKVIIVGAGLGGLATACALARRGHEVHVFEQARELGEVGAGIQMPPNSARILLKLGIVEFLQEKVVEPTSIKFRRWQSGTEIGCTRLVPDHKQRFGAPYYVVHRADFHEALHKLALKLGATVRIASKVQSYDPNTPSVTLCNGQKHDADLIIAADGLNSTARAIVVGQEDFRPYKTGFAAYRATVDVGKIKADPNIAWIVEQPNINLWIGDGCHAMTYPIASGKSLNLVLSHPESLPQPDQTLPEILNEMKNTFQNWDPQLTKLISLIHHTLKWPLSRLPAFRRCRDGYRGRRRIGRGATPRLIAKSRGASAEHLDEVRVVRCSQMQQASTINETLWHFKDGPEQKARDAAMRDELRGRVGGKSPNQWSDERTAKWCFGYDAEEQVRRRFELESMVNERRCTGGAGL